MGHFIAIVMLQAAVTKQTQFLTLHGPHLGDHDQLEWALNIQKKPFDDACFRVQGGLVNCQPPKIGFILGTE